MSGIWVPESLTSQGGVIYHSSFSRKYAEPREVSVTWPRPSSLALQEPESLLEQCLQLWPAVVLPSAFHNFIQ